MKKYIICGVFPAIFDEFTLRENCFLVIPDTLVAIVTAQWKWKKSWIYVDTNSEVSVCV